MSLFFPILSTLACFPGSQDRAVTDPSDDGWLTAPVVAIDGVSPSSDEPLLALVLVPGESSLGGSVSHELSWVRDGLAVPELEGLSQVDPEWTGPGEVWRLEARTAQGELRSDVAWDEVGVDNTPPTLSASLFPGTPQTDDDLEVTAEAVDPDGSAVTLTYTWYRDNELREHLTDPVVAAAETRRDEDWVVLVQATDAHAGTAESWLGVVISNGEPTLLGASLSPQPAYANNELTCTPVGYSDPDADAPTYDYQWTVTDPDGEGCNCHESPPPPVLDHAFLSRGTFVSCEVTPGDGEIKGATVYSAELEVQNSAPSTPTVTIDPPAPGAGDPLTARVLTPSEDPDGDAVTLAYSWSVDGTAVSTEPLVVRGTTQAGELWRVEVVASDDELSSDVASAEVVVAD